jgi:hypothetical protein
MRIVPLLAATAAAIALAAGAPAVAKQKNPEAALAKVLEGRVAGKPVDCIYRPSVRNIQIFAKTAIVYDAGSTLYVNRPRSGANSLSDWDVLVTKPTGSQLCSLDMVHLYDQGSHFQKGSLGLGQFVPYKKVSVRGGR